MSNRVTRPCVDGGRHDWQRPLFSDRLAKCARCGDAERAESCWAAGVGACLGGWKPPTTLEYVRRWCEFCTVRAHRLQAEFEQRPVMARLRSEEEEVVSLYQLPSRYHIWGTPQQYKERYPEWLQLKAERTEQRRQRKLLRQGRDTLAEIRRSLRRADRSPHSESKPARTSPTS